MEKSLLAPPIKAEDLLPLFEAFEKAHPEIFKEWYEIINSYQVTDGFPNDVAMGPTPAEDRIGRVIRTFLTSSTGLKYSEGLLGAQRQFNKMMSSRVRNDSALMNGGQK